MTLVLSISVKVTRIVGRVVLVVINTQVHMKSLLVEWDVRSFHYALIPRIEGLIGDLRGSIYIFHSFMEYILVILFVCLCICRIPELCCSFLDGYFGDIGPGELSRWWDA